MATVGKVFRDRNSRLFLTVTVVAGFGNAAMSLAASVWVLSLTGSASLAALCGLCVYAPSLFGPVIGTMVDRLPRQRLLIWTNALMAGVLLTLFLVSTRHDIWIIFVVMLGYGFSYVLVDAAESAVVKSVVPAERLGGLNSLRMSAQEGVKLVAPLVGAGLFTLAGGRSVAALAAAAVLIGSWLYTMIRLGQTPETVKTGPRSIRRETWQGLQFLFHHVEVRTMVLVASVVVGASGLVNAAGYVVITNDLHRPPAFAGVLATAQGAGSIIGGLLCGSLLSRRGERATAVLGAVLFAIGTLGLAVAWTPAVVAARVVIGVGLPWTVVAAFTALQRHTSEAMIGRVAASASTLIFSPLALTISLGAGLVTVMDHRLIFVIAAFAALVVAAALLPVPHTLTDAGRTQDSETAPAPSDRQA